MPPSIPRVSVVIPAYNAEAWVARAARSALAQDLSPLGPGAELEVVLVDDASSDGTRAALERLAAEDPRVRAFSNPVNLGCAGGRNRGLREARGDWVAILDADDAFAPGRLARLVAAAEAEGLDAVADLPELWDLAADAPAPVQPPADGRLERLDLRGFLEATAPEGARLDGLIKPVVRRELIASGLWRYPEESRVDEDFLLHYEALRRGVAFAVLHERLYVFSTRIGAVSGAWSPASVTPVNYRAVEASSRRLTAAAERAPDDLGGLSLDEVRAFMDQRIAKARKLDRRYGWNTLRMGAWRRHWGWLRRDPRNLGVLLAEVMRRAGRKLRASPPPTPPSS